MQTRRGNYEGTMDINNLVADIMSAANASDIENAANVGPAPANPPVPAQAHFTLLPARAIADVIDYSLSEGIKIYIKATSALPNIFDLSP